VWLEQQAQYTFKQSFVHLDVEQLETIITLAEQAPSPAKISLSINDLLS